MKVIVNRYIPLGDFVALNLCGLVFAKRELKPREIMHEQIHTRQILECLVVGYYIVYMLEFTVKLCIYRDCKEARYRVSFEEEAYRHHYFRHYLPRRKPYAWHKYILAR